MRGAIAVALCLLVAVIYWQSKTQAQNEGKGWKDLIPLRSTRRDVEALLGPPTAGGRSSYETNDAMVSVEYSNGPCEKGWPYGWNVDTDTIVSIIVSPKKPVMVTELNLDQEYLPSRDGHISSRIFYINSSAGITVEVDEFTRRAGKFFYHPTSAQQKLQCPDAKSRLPEGRSQADSFFKVDAYGDLSPDAERERLDSVAAYLIQRPETEAYLIAYAGRIAQKGEADSRASCARNYLIRKHKIQADRIRAIDGGFREGLEVEVYVEEKDGPLPLARPSVRPSAVKIIQQKPVVKCRV